MNTELIKEKRLFFLFSKLNDKEDNKTHFSLIVDTFLNYKNSYFNLFDISQKLLKIGINIKPEALCHIPTSDKYSNYFDLQEEFDINVPFKLKQIQYSTLSSYSNYYLKLNEYIKKYLSSENIDISKLEIIKEIMLATLFNRNLSFLKQLATTECNTSLENILILDKHKYFSNEDCGIYNDMVLTSNNELNEIIKILLYKIFDFLKLHYNPKTDTTLNENYKDKVFYLDSSFIIRLFGFDNEIREHRALELVGILSKVQGVKFIVHNFTIEETQHRIKHIIANVQSLLKHSDKTLMNIQGLGNKTNNTISLYLRLKQKRKITGKDDFVLHFSNVINKLRAIIGSSSIERDDCKIKYSKEKLDNLLDALSFTEKSSKRISHISKLLLYIEELRASNYYNVWLYSNFR